MARVEVVMPKMGESIAEGTIVRWLKRVGDPVEPDEDVYTLTTDKVDAEVPSPVAGILVEILAVEGQTVEVDHAVAMIETDAAAARAFLAGGVASAAPSTMPDAGDAPVPAQVPAVSPAPVATEAPSAGPIDAPPREHDLGALRRRRSTPMVRQIARLHGITDLGAIEGTGVSGRVTKRDILDFVSLHRAGADAAGARPAGGETAVRMRPETIGTTDALPATAAASTAQNIPAAPRAVAIPAPPTVAMPTRAAAAISAPSAPSPGGAPAGHDLAFVKRTRVHRYDNDRVEPMSRMRASIAENMLQARRSSAHCHTVWECDMTRVVRARKKLAPDFEARGAKLTYTAFFVAAVVEGLQAYPLLNAAIDGTEIVYRGSLNIGVASAVEEGLIVPVLKHADTLNLFGIAKGINDLAHRSRAGRLLPQDVSDGTFTVSNAGIWGSLFGVPILVQPQVGILGIGGMNKRVVADEDANIRVRSMCNMCLSFDHRLIDGATADGFMSRVTSTLRSWGAPA